MTRKLAVYSLILLAPLYAENHTEQQLKATARLVQDTDACKKQVAEIFDAIHSSLPKVKDYKLPKLDGDDEKSLDFYFKSFYEPKTDSEKTTALNKITDRSGKPTVYFSKLLLEELKKENPDKKNLTRYAKIIKNTAIGNENPLVENLGINALREYLKISPDKEISELIQKNDSEKTLEVLEVKDRKKEVNNLEMRIGILNTLPKDKKLEHLNALAKKLAEMTKEQSFFSCHDEKLHNQYETIRNAIFSQDILEDFLFLNQPGKTELEKILKNGDYHDFKALSQKYFYSVFGLKADFYHTFFLLKNNRPLLAAAHIEKAISNLNNLLKKTKDSRIKTEYENLLQKFYLLGAIAFKKVGDEENTKSVLEKLATNIELEKGVNLSSQKIKNASKCIQFLSGEQLFMNYYDSRPEDALVINGPYIYSMLQKKIPNLNEKIYTPVTFFREYGGQYPLSFDNNNEPKLDFCHPTLKNFIFRYGTSKENVLPFALAHALKIEGLSDRAFDLLQGKAIPLLPVLIENLKSRDLRSVNKSEMLIIGLREKSVPSLIPLLKDQNLQKSVIEILRTLGPDAHAAAPALIELLNDPEAMAPASGALMRIGKKAVPELIKALSNPNIQIKLGAIMILKLGEPAISAVPALITLLKDPSPLVISEASYALGNIGEASEPAVPQLIKLLHDDLTRPAAIYALGKIGEKAKIATPTLLNLLKTSEEKGPILLALSKIGEDIPSFLPMLIAHTKDKQLAKNAIYALGFVAKKEPKAIELLTDILKKGNSDEKYEVTNALGEAGENASSAVLELTNSLDHKYLQSASLNALRKIGPKASPAIGKIIPLLDAEESVVSNMASSALYSIGEKSIPPLISALAHTESDSKKFQISEVLGKFGEKADKAAPALMELVLSDYISAHTRGTAIDSLTQIGEKAAPFLLKGAQEKNLVIAYGCLEGLKEMGPKAKIVTPELKILLEKYKGDPRSLSLIKETIAAIEKEK